MEYGFTPDLTAKILQKLAIIKKHSLKYTLSSRLKIFIIEK